MLRQVLQKIVPIANAATQRNLGITAVVHNQDPIQQLFLDKIRDYRNKSQNGKLVDATPESEASLKEVLGNLERAFGAKGVDMTQFPTFNFTEPALVWPGPSAQEKAKIKEAVEAERKAEEKRLLEAQADSAKYDPFEGF
ncbi:unnamed protein product [Lymnaea stagnalis]|uniref:ATP synthase-coupling factor 6, mitochondrial n=1 Tax=Lymnaea stagnalis TaxID=6523 RepID=A0AAV2IGE0_LYMST